MSAYLSILWVCLWSLGLIAWFVVVITCLLFFVFSVIATVNNKATTPPTPRWVTVGMLVALALLAPVIIMGMDWWMSICPK